MVRRADVRRVRRADRRGGDEDDGDEGATDRDDGSEFHGHRSGGCDADQIDDEHRVAHRAHARDGRRRRDARVRALEAVVARARSADRGAQRFAAVAARSSTRFEIRRARNLRRARRHLEERAAARGHRNAPDFTKAGIGAGLTPNKTLKQEDLASLSQGVKDGAEQVEQALEKLAVRKNGWDLDANFGKRGQEPSRQAATVLRGLGNWPVASEALVYIARVDDGDRVLAGAHDYVVHFDKGKLPPAKAFWSISMYSARTAGLVPGAKRAELTDVAAKKSPDGSLDVILQGDAPAKNESNWLPAPKADSFILVLRVFQPADDAASWEAPVVKRIK